MHFDLFTDWSFDQEKIVLSVFFYNSLIGGLHVQSPLTGVQRLQYSMIFARTKQSLLCLLMPSGPGSHNQAIGFNADDVTNEWRVRLSARLYHCHSSRRQAGLRKRSGA